MSAAPSPAGPAAGRRGHRAQRAQMCIIHDAADLAIAFEQHPRHGATKRHRVLVPLLERRAAEVAAAEDGLAGLGHLNLHVLTAAQPPLHAMPRSIGRHHTAQPPQVVQQRGERGAIRGGHQHAAQGLAEAVDQQVDGHAAALRLDQRGQHADAVGVVLHVIRGQVQERSRLPHHREAPIPFGGPVPQRHQGGRQRSSASVAQRAERSER